MARINWFFRTSLTTVIQCYQYCISGFLGNCCRFEPTCSTYTMEAIKLHGCSKGSVLGLKRILRCHPWHPGGIDPVPAVFKNKG